MPSVGASREVSPRLIALLVWRTARSVDDHRCIGSGSHPSCMAFPDPRGGCCGQLTWGAELLDRGFAAGGDTVRYRVPADADVRAVKVSAQVLFQTVGYRWARSLADDDAVETDCFVGCYEANAADSAVVLAAAEARTLRPQAADDP